MLEGIAIVILGLVFVVGVAAAVTFVGALVGIGIADLLDFLFPIVKK